LLAIYLASSILANIAVLFDVGEPMAHGNVAVIPIKGIITGDGQDSFTVSIISSTDIVDLIEKANRNSNIKAVIFEINSPGGSAVASEEISNAISNLNKTRS